MNGAPLQLPPHLQAILQGVSPEQFAAIVQAMQSGTIPLPPAGLAPPPPTASALTPVVDTRLPPSHQPATIASEPRPSNGDVDMDQEDGEIEDSEVDGVSTPQARGFLRTPPKGPASSRRGSHQYTSLAQNGPRPGMTPRASSSTIPKAIVANGKAPVIPNGNAHPVARPNKEAASKAFVLEMHKAGYTYDDLAREVKDHQMLRRLYSQLGLPIPSASSVKPAMSQPVASPVNAVRKQVPAQPTKAPEKMDRSAYLAKLAAVKGKKTEAAKASATPPASILATQATGPAATEVASPAQTVPTASATTQPAVVVPESAVATTPTPVVKQPVFSQDKNALIRKRLEALRAEQAAKQKAKMSSEAMLPSSPAPPQVQSPTTGLGAGLTEATATTAKQSGTVPTYQQPPQHTGSMYSAPPSATASPIVNRSGFSLPGLSLPGLFPPHTTPPGPPSSSLGLNTDSLPSALQGYTASSPAQHNGINARQSSFGQSNNLSSTERCVIEVSSGEDEHDGDDDDDGEEMDIDVSSEDEPAHDVNPPPAVHNKAMAPLHSLPNSAGSSTPGTPNAWQRKLEEAAALRREIAEREERRRKVHPSTSALPSSARAPGLTAHLANGNSATLGFDGSRVTPLEAVDAAPVQKDAGLESHIKGSDSPNLKTDSGSPALPVGTSSALQLTEEHPPTVIANTTSDIEDDDDEDLYGEGDDTHIPQYQQAQDTRGHSFVDSQATTVSEESAIEPAEATIEAAPVDHADDDLYSEMEVDKMLHEQLNEASDDLEPSARLDGSEAGDDDDLDDDDLDNVYDPPPAIEVIQQAQKQDDAPAADNIDEDSDDAMDTSEESSSDSESDEDDDSSPDPPSIPAETAASPEHSSLSPVADDESSVPGQSSVQSPNLDIAPELQPANDYHDDTVRHDGPMPSTRYTPYASPLKRFKDYIYHPDFTNTASTGFKSLTFNHKIDPVKQLCYAELNEGQCDDPKCGWQHFREMGLLGMCCSKPLPMA